MSYPLTAKSKKVFLIALALNIIVCLLYVFLYRMVKDKNERTLVILQEVKVSQNLSQRLSVAREVIKVVDTDAVKLASYGVGSDEDQVKFVSMVETLGRAGGATVSVLNLKEDLRPGAADKDYFSMNISARGTWNQVIGFFTLLENVPMNIAIDDLRLQMQIPGSSGRLKSVEASTPLASSTSTLRDRNACT